GTTFDADAVKANLTNYMHAKGTALQRNVSDIASVDAVDEHTVQLKMKKPSTTVLSALSSESGGVMISPKALGSKDLGSHPVGTGAYVVDSFKPGQKVVYKRRTDKGGIWDPETGKPAKVTITTMDTDAEANAVKSGQVDLTTWSSSLKRFQSQIDSGQLAYVPMAGVTNMTGIYFNRTKKPFNDPLVRKAVNYAIDREALTEAFQAPGTKPRVQPWPDGIPGFDKSLEKTYPYDPDKAK